MFIYFSRLYEKYRKPILPIAIFSYNDQRGVPDKIIIEIPTFKIVEFHYLSLHLIKMEWRKFLRSNNPVAAALLSKMDYLWDERIQVKLEFLRMITRLELNPAKMELIYGFFVTYLSLNEEEEEQMRKEISRLPEDEAKAVFKFPNYYFEKGIEKGIEKVVCEMYKKGLPEDLIVDVSQLPIEKVREIKQKMNKIS